MQPPHFLFLGRNIMSTCSAPALGVQLSCCLAVKAFPTVTGSTQDLELGQGSKGGRVNQEALPWDRGKYCHLLYAMSLPLQ